MTLTLRLFLALALLAPLSTITYSQSSFPPFEERKIEKKPYKVFIMLRMEDGKHFTEKIGV
jgi:hypothetical protein